MAVEVVRKAIKNLHLGVYPPDGRVRLPCRWRLSDAAVRVQSSAGCGGFGVNKPRLPTRPDNPSG